MKKEAFYDQTEENVNSIANIHILTQTGSDEKQPSTYHYHNCMEILIVQQGTVRILVNYILKELHARDIIMLHNNLPHEVMNHSERYKLVIIHFPQNILPWETLKIPELHKEQCFIRNSECGYLFAAPQLTAKIIPLVRKIRCSNGFMRISHLFHLLHLLSESKAVGLLVNEMPNILKKQPGAGETSINRTFRFLYQHYTEEHSLEEIAEYANQNKAALCRSFKKVSGYTIFQYINRLRIDNACRLLKNTDQSITDIAYIVGYNTFSHFNSQFRRVMKLSPSQYRKGTDA